MNNIKLINYLFDWFEKGWGNSFADLENQPLWEFGYGLSYTDFEYSALRISPEKLKSGISVRVSVKVTNTGNMEGSEIVQLYIRDVKSSVVRPVKELKGFSKVTLSPEEEAAVEFEIKPEDLSMYDRNMNRIVEPGIFEVMIGSSSQKIHLKGSFEILDDK